jgi:uncharacterized membrane protein (DUF2068 family)
VAKRRSNRVIVLIGVFKLVKAALLFALAAGALGLRHHDVIDVVRHAALSVHLDPSGRIVNWLIGKAASLSPHRLTLVTVGTAVYASLFLAEGIGLILRKRWGEILTIVITGSFIPWEIYEAVKATSPIKLVLIALNVAIVAYLVWRVRTDR